MKKIIVEFIEQKDQRYPTVGDYFDTDDAIHFKITRMSTQMFSVAILLHEIHEYFRLAEDGISVEEIDKFDIDHPELEEPGDDPRAPYHKQHLESSVIERASIAMSGRLWSEYEKEIDSLFD